MDNDNDESDVTDGSDRGDESDGERDEGDGVNDGGQWEAVHLLLHFPSDNMVTLRGIRR